MIVVLIGFPELLRRRPATLLAKPPAHGVSFTVEFEGTDSIQTTNDFAMFQDALRKRSERLGVGIYCEQMPDAKVYVAAAARGAQEELNLKRALFREGRLEFRLVHEDSDRMIRAGELPPGYEILEDVRRFPAKERRTEQLIVKKRPEPGLRGRLIEQAFVTRGELGDPQISFVMRPEAAAAFAVVTRDNVGRRLAIVIDGKFYSAPTINSPIETGTAIITGNFEIQEAVEIGNMLDCPLPLPVRIVESKEF